MRLEPEGGRALQQIQEDKRRLFVAGEGSFALRLSGASMALGISLEDLRRVFLKQGKALTVRSVGEDLALFSLKDIYPERDLWDEILGTLKQGRSRLGSARDLYDTLFVTCKQLIEDESDRLADMPVTEDTPAEIKTIVDFLRAKGNSNALDVELGDLQQMASVVYSGLTDAFRKELEGQARSPGYILVKEGI